MCWSSRTATRCGGRSCASTTTRSKSNRRDASRRKPFRATRLIEDRAQGASGAGRHRLDREERAARRTCSNNAASITKCLNAKFHKREAEIVAQAGRSGRVTIATNMAGRGTDIILGGNPETMAWARLQDKYETRLDVPREEWDALVEEIETDGEHEGRRRTSSSNSAACTSSAPSDTTRAASTCSCAAAAVAREIPGAAASSSRWKTT